MRVNAAVGEFVLKQTANPFYKDETLFAIDIPNRLRLRFVDSLPNSRAALAAAASFEKGRLDWRTHDHARNTACLACWNVAVAIQKYAYTTAGVVARVQVLTTVVGCGAGEAGMQAGGGDGRAQNQFGAHGFTDLHFHILTWKMW